MKKSITCLLLLFAAVSALPAQSETFKVKADINWERDLIRIRVENGLNPDIFVIQEAKLQANRDYADRMAFGRKCLMNVASAAKFSSDRTIRQYAEEIWHIKPLEY